MRSARRLLRLPLAAVMLAGLPSWAADGSESPPLRPVADVRGAAKTKPEGPRYFEASRIEGVLGGRTTATGDVTLRQEGLALRADHIEYEEAIETAIAGGNVVLDRDGDIVKGDTLELKLNAEVGYLDNPRFYFSKKLDRRQEAWGSAARVDFEGDDKERFVSADYTTCRPGDDEWTLRISELGLDHSRSIGTGYNGTVMFKGVPILYMPYMTFPLNNDRKSGFLPPSFGSSSNSGLELTLPYYWNIAPNMDATLTPKILTRRGLQLGSEFRYLEPRFQGQFDAEYLPNDQIIGRDRYLAILKHTHNLADWIGAGWTSAINAQMVSDDNYFRDLSTRIANTAQTNLPRDVTVNYGNGWLGFSAHALSYQTLQDPAAPVVPPYKLAPQLILTSHKDNYSGFDLNLSAEMTDFRHPTLVNGARLIINPSLAFPITRSYGFFTPKLGYSYTRYEMGENNEGFANATRSLPITSVDTGLAFERDFSFRGTPLVQTLEPRLYYLYVPFRDQSHLPNFSTAETDFNFAQIFTENIFIGGDRVADANQFTLAVTSRFIEKETGIERLRAAFGQRFYLSTPKVTLNTPGTDEVRSNDLLAALAGQVSSSIWLDSSFQYSTNKSQLEKTSAGVRYSPDPGRIFNLSYRYTRDSLRQVDLSTQWPVKPGWTMLGRLNQSLQDKRLLEGLLGLEYNHACWALRMVAHRFTTATQQYSNSILLQLELKGLSRLGVNPLETLRQNIPGYQRYDETTQ
jgi:LPS-assembly protein